MQLGKALLGAIIGAVLGIALLAAAYRLFGLDKSWLAVVVAILTGFGVRVMVSTRGHASYLRGAMTGVLALAAYLAGWYLVAQLATRAAAEPNRPAPIAAVSEQPAGETDAEEATDDAAEEPADVAAPPATAPVRKRAADNVVMQKSPMSRQFSTIDFIWLCVAALVAYELGRGTGAVPVEVVRTTGPEPVNSAAGGAADPALNRGTNTPPLPPQVIRPPD